MDWIETYASLIEDDDENHNIEYVSELINKNKPQKLYRYRSYGKNWRDELYEEKIFLSNPSKFNDPFDCTLNVDFKKHMSVMKSRLFDEIEIDNKSSDYFDNAYRLANSVYTGIRERYRIACFTPFFNSILMWSHYAASHTGYCIEYDVEKIYRITDTLFPVIYSKKRYDNTNYLIGKSKKGINHLIHKASEWSYENEWRIISHEELLNKEKGDFLELPDAITAIYLGANSHMRSEVNTIIKWARICDIPIYKMRPSKKQYKLIKEKV